MAYQEGFVVSVFQTNEKLSMEKNILNTMHYYLKQN